MKFELNDYKQELTDDEILLDIKNPADLSGAGMKKAVPVGIACVV